MNQDKSKAEADGNFRRLVERIWVPIAGVIGAVTLVVQTIQLWRGDQATVTGVAAVLGAVLLLGGLAWTGYSKRTYEIPLEILPGHRKLVTEYRFPRAYTLARMGLFLCLAAGLVGGYFLLRHRQELAEKVVILVATFDGPEDRYGMTNQLIESLNDTVKDHSEIQIIPLGETITPIQGIGFAREIGKRYLADVVIWGWYRPTDNPNLIVHVENLEASDLGILYLNDKTQPDMRLAEMESFELQQRLGLETSNLVLFLSGYSYYKAEDYPAALKRFDEALSSDEWMREIIHYSAALLVRSNTNFRMKKYEEALAGYTEIIEIDPKFFQAYNNRGSIFLLRGQYDQAIDDFTATIKINPDYADAYSNRGVAFGFNGIDVQSIADNTAAIKINPEVAGYYLNRGVSYHALGIYSLALEDYSRAIDLDPKYALAYNNRANLYVDNGNPEQAIPDYSKSIRIDPDFAGFYNNRGQAYVQLRSFEKAISDFDRAIVLDPKFAGAYGERGGAYAELGQVEKAFADFAKAIVIDPNNETVYNDRGNVYFKLGNYEQAVADYTQAIQINPKDAGHYYNRGTTYERMDQLPEALSDYDEAIKIDPENRTYYILRGNLYGTYGQYDRAISDYDSALKIDPEYAYTYCIRGSAYYMVMKDKEAAADLRQCIQRTTDPQLKSLAEEQLKKITNP